MAFTVIGAWAATALGFAGTAATIAGFGLSVAGVFVASAIGIGLAAVTSRLINGSSRSGGGTAQDPGVRIQLPPATNNKVPVVYGSVFTKGTVTDARLSSSDGTTNDTMTYVLQLSEKTQTGTFTVGDIFWNDQKLVFSTDAGSEHVVVSSIDQNGLGNSSTNYNGLIKVRIYAGSTAATSQIFPLQSTGNTQNARTTLGESDTNYLLTDLVFAVVQLKYSNEKGITGLAQMTFQINNTLNNPGNVWYDYMTSTRYGAAIPAAQIDTASSISTTTSTSLYSWSNTIPPNQYESDGTTTSTQARYVINGVISPGDTVKNNLDRINMNCNAWTTFDFSQGLWKIIVNREATAGELASAFEFNDDNIVGDISISATNLEDLYNSLEVEFASRKIRDQNDYYRAEVDPAELNDLEPPNTMNLRLDLVNNAIHSGRVGQIELKQSRVDLVVTFRTDYSALQVEAGDVIKLTNSIYGFNEKLFRVTRTKEIEAEDGLLGAEITALEYAASVYDDEYLVDSAENTASGIGSFDSSLPAPTTPTVTGYATANPAYFVLQTTITSGSLPVDSVDFLIATTAGGTYSDLITVQGPFNGGDVVTSQAITGQSSGTYYFKARTTIGSRHSADSSASSALTWTVTPLTPSAPYWDTSTSTNTDLFPNAGTPYFTLHADIPVGSIEVSSVTFYYSTNSSTGFTQVLNQNGPWTGGSSVYSSPIVGIPADTYYFKVQASNNGNLSSFSSSSIALVWDPNPTFDGGVIP